ncbi:MAG TPA: hypothetical protein VLV18_03645 [Terriglobales bacterium]|nr:hypothetical protein [Terriglobales bacterium]
MCAPDLLGAMAMAIVSAYDYDNPSRFLEHARQFLEMHEAENNLMLGVTSWFATHPERLRSAPYFVVVEDNDVVKGAAMMTPPSNSLSLGRSRQFLRAS